MRDKKRIKRILNLIESIWNKHNDLRLMQLLNNCFSHLDSYYEEDEVLERRLKDTYGEGK